MTLDDVFTQLAHGEFSQLFLANDGEGVLEVPETKRAQVTSHVKLGLTELHKRFFLREEVVTLQMMEGKQTYVIDSAYAMSNTKSAATPKYILDSESPFTDNLLKIERIYDADGTELSFNNNDDPDSIRVTGPNVLVVPSSLATASLKVIFRADHPKLSDIYAQAVPFKVPIHLSTAYLRPLLLFVASRAHTPVGLTAEFHDGNNYAAKYEAACVQLETWNFDLDHDNEDTRFNDRGWV